MDVLKYGPDQIAMMVASEFLRASERTQYASIANNCFERARELMGILETIPLTEDVAQELSPVYGRCTRDQLMIDDRMPLERVRKISLEVASAFEKASENIRKAGHA